MKQVDNNKNISKHPRTNQDQVGFASGGFVLGIGSSALHNKVVQQEPIEKSIDLPGNDLDVRSSSQENLTSTPSASDKHSYISSDESDNLSDIAYEEGLPPNMNYVHPSKITIEVDLTIKKSVSTVEPVGMVAHVEDLEIESNRTVDKESKWEEYLQNDQAEDLTNLDSSPQEDTIQKEIDTPDLIPQYGVYDINEDGFSDVMVIDSNADGYVDVICMDQDANFEADTFLVDYDGNGILDYLILDTDEDGIDGSENYEEIEKQISIDQFDYLEEYDPIELLENAPHEDSQFI